MNIRRIVGLAGALSFVSLAQAHTHLVSSEPSDGSVVTTAPSTFVAQFTEATRVTALAVMRDNGKEEKLTPPSAASQRLSAPLPKLEPGKYVLTWRAVGNDTHVMSGKVTFTYDPTGKAVAGHANESKHAH